MRVRTGRCLCGKLELRVTGDPVYAGFCHCSECRQFSGSAFSAFAGFPKGEVEVVGDSERYLGRFVKTENTEMQFCTSCGSSLLAVKKKEGLAHVRLGVMDPGMGVKPQAHVHVGSKADWYELPSDGLPKFETVPPPAVIASLKGK